MFGMKLPAAFEDRMKNMLGTEYLDFAAACDGEREQGLRLNRLKTERDEFLKKNPFSLEKIPWEPDGFYYGKEDRPGRHPYHDAGVYYIQEPSAMAVAALLNPQPGDRILDLCAAPGGKTTQIAPRLQGKGFLLSNEIHPSRAKILSQNVERMGIQNAVVTNESPEHLTGFFRCFFDRIVVDAPCSGEGMFRKEEAALREWSPENVKRCAERQQEILDCAADMLRPGGRMVYSTCTFAPEENEGSISRFIERHPEFVIEDVPHENGFSFGIPKWAEGAEKDLEKTVRLWPHRLRGEGHFIAVMRKCGEEEESIRRSFPVYLKDKNIQGMIKEFCSETLREPAVLSDKKELVVFGEQLYLLPPEMPDFKGLKVLRPGLHLGTFRKNRFEPSHAWAMALKPEDVFLHRDLKSTSPEIVAFLRGETLADRESGSVKKGWVLMTVDGYSIGWSKLAGGMLKNHYPKGLRRKLEL